VAPATGTAVLIIAAFVLPGFVTILIKEYTYTIPGQNTPFERLLNTLYNATLVYGVVLALALAAGVGKQDLVDIYHGRKPLGVLVLAAALVLLVAPLVIAESGRWWRRSRLRRWVLGTVRIDQAHGVDSGWNQAFSSIGVSFVRITTKDRRVVGGLYDAGSLAGYSQQSQDLYLIQRWELDADNWFIKPAASTRGVWVPRDNIASIELYSVGSSGEG
jgi:Family of unknown function (DUF6338)